MKSRVFVLCIAWALLYCVCAARAQEAPHPASASLQRLKDGNERFVTDQLAKKDLSHTRREQLSKGQHPFAVILACADSRVAPELIFDQGLGDLFVLRVAGNVTDPEMLGSIEFALTQLEAPLIVVLGHEQCGAVKAALTGGNLSGNLGKLIERVYIGKDLPQDKSKALTSAIQANVVHHLGELSRQSPVIKDFVQTRRVTIIGGVYSLDTGKVRWLERSGDKPDSRNGR